MARVGLRRGDESAESDAGKSGAWVVEVGEASRIDLGSEGEGEVGGGSSDPEGERGWNEAGSISSG